MNENQTANEHATRKKSRTGLKILLIILGVFMLGGITVGILILKEVYESRYRLGANVYTVFAETLTLVKKVSDKNGIAVFETDRELPFGAKVVLERDDIIRQDGKTYLICNSYRLRWGEPDYTCEKNHYLEITGSHDIHDGFYGESLLNMFPLKETRQLPILLRTSIVEHLNETANTEYCFPQDANRIGASIVKADFNNDGEEDYAVVMQSGTTNPTNRLIILCYNPDIPKYYVAFYDYNSGLATITTFDKGARIYIKSEQLVKAPNIGIIYQNQGYGDPDYGKYALFYDPELQQFVQHRQMPQSVQSESHEYDEYDEYDGDGGEEYSELRIYISDPGDEDEDEPDQGDYAVMGDVSSE